MGCGACGRRGRSSNSRATKPEEYNLTGGVDVRSLNHRQINARLEVFKRKFCNDCKIRYDCNYTIYMDCKGLNKR